MQSVVKEVDCALIFMLDEERDLFLENNKDFIISNRTDEGYIEFSFFDKRLSRRSGVICSNAKRMGNTEACQLFYRLSRSYKAHLYINLGVSGMISDVNIGDVVIADRISTIGEQKANTNKHQTKDFDDISDRVQAIHNKLIKELHNFSESTTKTIKEFKQQIAEKVKDLDGLDFYRNQIRTGWCVTVPEVVKDRNKWPVFDEIRKINLIDMEAYYLAEWHKLVNNMEPSRSIAGSDFLVFKSISDYGDNRKSAMESCGSRKIAMKNLYTVVTAYCTRIHNYPRESNQDLYDFFREKIADASLDDVVRDSNIPTGIFSELFSNIVHCEIFKTSDRNLFDATKNFLYGENRAILLKGRSGTGKSAFLSYLYKSVSNDHKSILVDFSKFFHDDDIPNLQIATLLERFIASRKNCLLFIDGISANSDIYDIIKKAFDENEYSNLSFCIGNLDSDFDDLCDVISGKKTTAQMSFCGVNVFSPQYEDFIAASQHFFNAEDRDFPTPDILKFIKDSRVNSVDFRLMTMLANFSDRIAGKKSLYTFVKECMAGQYKESDFQKYWKSTIEAEEYGKSIPDKMKLNPDFCSIAISKGIAEAFSANTDVAKKEVEQILKRNYVLSNDMNLMFEALIKNKKNYISIVSNILENLKQGSTSISTETQLLYSMCRIVPKQSSCYGQLHAYTIELINKVQEMISKTGETCDPDYMIQYRTLCIILNRTFGNKSFLHEYNSNMIHDERYMDINLSFHLFYYSKREFSFRELHQFDPEKADYEMWNSTFYTLAWHLGMRANDEEKKLLIKKVTNKDPQIVMNIITFMCVVERKCFPDFEDNAFEVLANIKALCQHSLDNSGEDEQYRYIVRHIGEIMSKIAVEKGEMPT